MMKLLTFMFFICASLNVAAQYPFEKYPNLQLGSYCNWKTYEKTDRVHTTSTIQKFFENDDELTIQLTSYKDHFNKNSSIRIFKNQKQIIHFHENFGFIPDLDSLRVGDINNDGLKDIKIVESYRGNGLNLLSRVIYLLQKPGSSFEKISFDDIMFYGERKERDFDGDGNYEIITMNLQEYKNHNYWVFNLYNIVNGKLVNVNEKADYPIMIPFLNKDSFEITKKLSRRQMKDFTMKFPEGYIAK